jgi:hypothetical protein
MNQQDYKIFVAAWATAHEVMPAGKVLSSGAMKMCIDALDSYPLAALLLAIKKHVQSGRYAPAPKDIIDLLEAHNKRPTADEAWAALPGSEAETIVWTQEMAEAYAIAYDLIIGGDRIAARMAFKAAYERLCSESNIMGRGIAWTVCLGYDKRQIEPALMKAVAAGRITQSSASKLLPASTDSGLIAGLITGKITELPANNENLKKHWRGLAEALKTGEKRLEERRRQRAESAGEKQLKFEAQKIEIMARIDAKLRSD